MRFIGAILTSLVCLSAALANPGYEKPPQAVLEVLNAPLPPVGSLSPPRNMLLLAEPLRYPPIADLAQPVLRLAGAYVNPENNAQRGNIFQAFPSYFKAIRLKKIPDGPEVEVDLPKDAHVNIMHWSADGKHVAFVNTTPKEVQLWVLETATGHARHLSGLRLNSMLGSTLEWMPDQHTLLVKAVLSDRSSPLAVSRIPLGPKIEQCSGEGRSSSTYEARDVLKSPQDAELFEYYATSQLALVDVQSGKISRIGAPGVYDQVNRSPDGRHVLVGRIQHPYSYLVAYERFPKEVEVWTNEGRLEHKLASLPLAERVPIQGVPTGPRDYSWRADHPATLIWAEALDGGDPRTKVPYRDRLMMWKAPFQSKPIELMKTQERYIKAIWSDRNSLVLIHEFNVEKYWERVNLLRADFSKRVPQLLWERSIHEHYNDPGTPVMRTLPSGFEVLEDGDSAIYLAGTGASPTGDRPFLDRLDLQSRKSERLFRSESTSFESFFGWVDRSSGKFLTRRESPSDFPNYFMRTLQPATKETAAVGESTRASIAQAITRIPDPTPQLRQIKKQIVTYRRADGTPLSFTLFLPPGYVKGQRLPTVFSAYPLDHTDPSTAGQVTGSTQRFLAFASASPMFFLLDGYAILENPSMPVIGDSLTAYDTFIEQLVADAKAAVEKAVEMGVTDPNQIGVIGHSHGGLMAATLLGNTNLFRAGIARSGAYNHTLRPFGFQNERRTYWEAPETYTKLSPVLFANRIKKPLLLIHGELDSNPGTVSLQSEKLYDAIRGNGGTARLVILPLESHWYLARESTEHVLFEMLTWFDKYVKAPQHASNR